MIFRELFVLKSKLTMKSVRIIVRLCSNCGVNISFNQQRIPSDVAKINFKHMLVQLHTFKEEKQHSFKCKSKYSFYFLSVGRLFTNCSLFHITKKEQKLLQYKIMSLKYYLFKINIQLLLSAPKNSSPISESKKQNFLLQLPGLLFKIFLA